MKPSFTKSWTVILALLALTFSAVGVTPARAASIITVNSTSDNITIDGACTLREAITNANADLDTTGGDCIAGSGNDTIIFDSSLGTATITLVLELPVITDNAGLTIDGDNRITLSGNDSVRVLYVGVAGLLTLQNIIITHGSAAQGGGLFSEGTLIIIHSAFLNNSSTGSGGGVTNAGGTATITNSTFSNNSATGDGGGAFNSGTLTIANSTFSNNSANAGGGVINNSGTATILNSTFSGNSAIYEGGGVFTWNGGASPPTTTIRNTILANSAPGYADCWNHATGTLSGGNNIIETATTCNSIATITSDPNLGSLAGSPAYFPLNAGSPAIDAGDDAVCAAVPVSNTSQNGLTRPQGMHCDIGSVEALRFLIYLPLVMR